MAIFVIAMLWNGNTLTGNNERKYVMKKLLTSTDVDILNKIAKNDFDRAVAMLDGINLVLGTNYGWMDKKVVWVGKEG